MFGSCRLSCRSNSCWFIWTQDHTVSCPSSSPLPLHTLEFTSNNTQPTMSLNFIHYPSSEITDLMREDPCYPPPRPLQLTDAPSPESFDQEVDSDEEVSTYLPSEQIDALFSATGTRDTNPAISTTISTPSTITSSTDSSSQYSFSITPSESEYLKLSEFETHDSVNSRLYSMQAFISSPEFTNPLPCIPPVNLAEVRGTMDLNPSFFADNYSTPVQLESATCVNPAALSRAGGIDTALSPHVISDSGAQMAPVKKPLKPFKCPLCPFCKSEPICICNWLTPLASLCAHA